MSHGSRGIEVLKPARSNDPTNLSLQHSWTRHERERGRALFRLSAEDKGEYFS